MSNSLWSHGLEHTRLPCSSLSPLFKFTCIESVMLSSHLIPHHPLLLLPTIFPSIRVFFIESSLCLKWPKYWSFSFSMSPSSEYSGLISLRMDWFVLPAAQGTFIFLNNFMYLFIFDCAESSLSHGLFFICLEQELLSRCRVRASHCGGFYYCRAWL